MLERCSLNLSHFHATFTILVVSHIIIYLTCAFVVSVVCKETLPAFLDTLGFQEEKRLFTAGALTGTLALETVALTA